MVYQNKLVACIKVNGKVLREEKEFVTLPFGSEYSILIKNMNSVRVQVKVSIDGTDATEGTWLIIQPNSSLELERFIKGGNLTSGNRFKFIERTKEIEDHRGIEVDDGLVRIEYATEKVIRQDTVVTNHRNNYYDWRDYYCPRYYRSPYYWDGGIYCGMLNNGSLGSAVGHATRSLGNVQASNSSSAVGQNTQNYVNCSAASMNEVGITVPGSQSDQKFVNVMGFDTHTSEVLILRLRGVVNQAPVAIPVTVDLKKNCKTCGRVNDPNHKFCSNCGTALTII